jgi:LuxR family maltose regulon positive regulatory protein
MLIRRGALHEAEQYLAARQISADGEVTYPHQNEYLAMALLLVRGQRWEPAQRLLDRLEQYCAASEMQVWLIPVRLMRARIYLAHGQTAQVQTAVREAWAFAVALGRYQDFQGLDETLLPLFLQIADRDQVPEAIWSLIAGDGSLSNTPAPLTSAGVAGPDNAGDGPRSKAGEPVERLSERELEVLRLIACGLSNRAIALRLHVEVQTVKYHAGNIYGKLGVENRLQAVTRAQQLGLV